MPRKAKRNCQDNPLEKGCYVLDLRELAEESIMCFFEDKSFFCGGEIPICEMLSDDSIKTVLRTQHDDPTFDFIHNKCLCRIPKPPGISEVSLTWEVQFLLSLLEDMKQKTLPREFQPGLLLLYFKLCRGYEIPPPPLF